MPSRAASSGWIITVGRTFPRQRTRRLVERRVEEAARRRRREPERMLVVRHLDDGPVIRQLRHLLDRPAGHGAAERHVRPVRLEAELAVRPVEAVDVVRRLEIRLAVDPALGFELGERAPAGLLQACQSIISRGVMSKPGCSAPSALRQRADHLVVGTAFARRLDRLGAEHDVLVAAALIDVVVLHEHGRRQHQVGHPRGLGHELLVHADEQILAGKAALHHLLVGTHRNRIGVLDQHRGDRRTAAERIALSPVRMAPIRDWSSMRTDLSRTSCPSIIDLFQ